MTFTDFVNRDKTYKYFLRDACFDFNKLEWQVYLRCKVTVNAISEFLYKKYDTQNI